uniref:(northern house mosquito) hypothetical protein n=1 Tax=Culex pipiens TaxID=7175 RepID=A0A8D8FIZ4_CULPI
MMMICKNDQNLGKTYLTSKKALKSCENSAKFLYSTVKFLGTCYFKGNLMDFSNLQYPRKVIFSFKTQNFTLKFRVFSNFALNGCVHQLINNLAQSIQKKKSSPYNRQCYGKQTN